MGQSPAGDRDSRRNVQLPTQGQRLVYDPAGQTQPLPSPPRSYHGRSPQPNAAFAPTRHHGQGGRLLFPSNLGRVRLGPLPDGGGQLVRYSQPLMGRAFLWLVPGGAIARESL